MHFKQHRFCQIQANKQCLMCGSVIDKGVYTKCGAKHVDLSGGCYIATAVYGSYDCPQVWTLRRYRDFSLAKTLYGRVFIRTYYAISPSLVRWFGDSYLFNKIWKKKLDNMINKLQSKDFESTPYND